MTLKIGSRSPKPNKSFVLSNRYTFASFETNHPLAQDMIKAMHFKHFLTSSDLENRVKVTKIRSLILHLPLYIYIYICAGLVKIYPSFQEIKCKQDTMFLFLVFQKLQRQTLCSVESNFEHVKKTPVLHFL